jgi:peptidoglycan/LPS O-acetylase OafA/YrhL
MREHVRSGTEALDGLRGLALLMVVCYHTWLFSWFTPELQLFGAYVPVDVLPRNGYLGVDLFFTISGFVLAFPHALRALGQEHERQSTSDYAFRRFIKIVPSYALALVATFFFSIEYISPADLWKNLATHALFIQNAYVDGFGRANSVFWSLAVEVQFYVIFPLLARAFRRAPVATTAAMTLVALGYRYALASCCVGVETVTRQLPAYLDLFAAGMLAAYLVVWIRLRRPEFARPAWAYTVAAALCVWGGFALMRSVDTVAYQPLGPQRWDLGHRTLVALLGGGLAFASCFALRFWRAALANRVFVFLSIVSYNVYLWHTLLMVWMWKHGVPPAATADPHGDDRWKFAFIALGWSVTLVVSTALTYFVERPLLGLVKPQSFAFDWSRLRRRKEPPALRPAAAAAQPETRT